MQIDASMVKELREKTGCGIMECKGALAEAQGNMENAIDVLRKRGLKAAASKAGRSTSEGLVGSYIHMGGKIGVLLEINCETDFVARTDDFQWLLKEISLHIAACSPQYVKREDVPQAVIDKEKEIYAAQMADSGKPQNIVEKIVQGKLEKGFFGQVCLLEQAYMRDPGRTIQELIGEKVGKLGENISVRRFTRWAVGE